LESTCTQQQKGREYHVVDVRLANIKITLASIMDTMTVDYETLLSNTFPKLAPERLYWTPVTVEAPGVSLLPSFEIAIRERKFFFVT
jgi:hypothetical protein